MNRMIIIKKKQFRKKIKLTPYPISMMTGKTMVD
jgi:hypothetical protein